MSLSNPTFAPLYTDGAAPREGSSGSGRVSSRDCHRTLRVLRLPGEAQGHGAELRSRVVRLLRGTRGEVPRVPPPCNLAQPRVPVMSATSDAVYAIVVSARCTSYCGVYTVYACVVSARCTTVWCLRGVRPCGVRTSTMKDGNE